MAEHASMDGRYYRTCSNDIKSSPGWFKNILLLGLLSFVPVFGQMCTSGYAIEWGHKAAWRVQSPMPYKLFGRENSKMLRWGWFALVIELVFLIVPYIVYTIGGSISDASQVPSLGMYSHGTGAGYGNAAGVAFGGIVEFVGLLGIAFAGLLSWAGIIRMTIYDRLGTGLQFKQVWKMAKRDFGGLLRILGMELIVGAVICLLGFAVFAVSLFVGGASFLFALLGSYAYGFHGSMGAASLADFVMMIMTILPLLLLDAYIVSCMLVYADLLVGRAVGYWCAQFDVPAWGKKDDPLPFEREARDEGGEPERPAGDEAAAARADAEPEPEAAPESEPEPEAGPQQESARGTGPVGWRAAGTSSASHDEDDHFNS